MCIKENIFKKIYNIVLVLCLIVSWSLPVQNVEAKELLFLNIPSLSSVLDIGEIFDPMLVKGLTLYPNEPFKFDFIIDLGMEGYAYSNDHQFKQESMKFIKYFLATLTIPDDQQWVNLSPYEKDRVIPENLEKTDLGRDLLLQDYILKQFSSSLMSPERSLGKALWKEIFDKMDQRGRDIEGIKDLFHKIWIVPNKARVYEKGNSVFIVENNLKVMMEDDYLSFQKGDQRYADDKFSKDLLKKMILPFIEREVNQGKHFAPLRQIYNAMLLAVWYKRNLKESLLANVYVNQNRIEGISNNEKHLKDKIYERYLEGFRNGVVDFIEEEYIPRSGQLIIRRYFSGGIENYKNVSIETVTDFSYLSGWKERVKKVTWQLYKKSVPVFLLSVFLTTNVLAHPGRVNKNGYHTNKKTGIQHSHGSSRDSKGGKYDRKNWRFNMRKSPFADDKIGFYTGLKREKTDVDHIVSLKDAFLSGGKFWKSSKKIKFANDSENHVPALEYVNRILKNWYPPKEFILRMKKNKKYRFAQKKKYEYVKMYVAIKKEYNLNFSNNDMELLDKILLEGKEVYFYIDTEEQYGIVFDSFLLGGNNFLVRLLNNTSTRQAKILNSPVGGIDLNQEVLNLHIQGSESMKTIFSTFQKGNNNQDLDEVNVNRNYFVPVILNILQVNANTLI